MPNSIHITIGDVGLQLFAKRAAFSATHATLFVADPHFGKEATFRRGGLPVPQGATDGTLRMIAQLLDQTKAQRLVILGDMFHARSSLSPDVCLSLDQFFEDYRDVEHILIRGNHDAHVGQLPGSWPVQILDPGERLGRIMLTHHPGKVCDREVVVLCGHLHPAIRVGTGSDSLGKLPCFWLSEGCMVLPAIGQFTGTHVVCPGGKDRAWAIADDHVFSVSSVPVP